MENDSFVEPCPWFRSTYRIEEDSDGVKFITQVGGRNNVETYFPDEIEPDTSPPFKELLMKSAPYIALARLEPDDEEQILEFVSNWGLLGLWNIEQFRNGDDLLRRYRYDVEEIFTDITKTGRASRREPLHLFVKAVKDFQQYLNNLVDFRNAQNNLLIGKKQIKAIEYDIQKLEMIEDYNMIRLAKKHKVSVQDIENIRLLNMHYLSLNLHRNKMLRGNVSPQYLVSTYKNQDDAGWYFNSLLSYIYQKTAEVSFKRCQWKKCRKLLVSNKRDYCATQCKQSQNSDDLKVRRWKRELSNIYNTYDPKFIEYKVDIILEKGISGFKRIQSELEFILQSEEK